MDNQIVLKARQFAIARHGEQKRKYTNAPYWHHPRSVARMVWLAGGTADMMCAAWLHDVLEDTSTTLDEIEGVFGRDVAAFVNMLTDVSRPQDGNRAARKLIDRNHLALAAPEAKTVKLADMIDNLRDIVAHDHRFAVVYVAEMQMLLPLLVAGDPVLHTVAQTMVHRVQILLRDIDYLTNIPEWTLQTLHQHRAGPEDKA